jgi:hypothetical protein
MSQRVPPVYNTSATNVTVVASFTAKGLSKTPTPGRYPLELCAPRLP